MLFLQLLLNGLALGAAYALAALGFVLVLNASRAVNFAQGDLVMAGGFVAVALGSWLPLPGVVLLPAVLALMALLGLAVGLVAYVPLKDRPPTSIFISTIAGSAMTAATSAGSRIETGRVTKASRPQRLARIPVPYAPSPKNAPWASDSSPACPKAK